MPQDPSEYDVEAARVSEASETVYPAIRELMKTLEKQGFKADVRISISSKHEPAGARDDRWLYPRSAFPYRCELTIREAPRK
jgi:hypothetical protein